MPSTAPYAPTWDFGTDPAPQDKVNAQALQTQLQLIADNLADLITALGTSIRDDNTLTDELVRARNLHPELSTIIDQLYSGTVASYNFGWKQPVKAASTANVVNLFGNQTIDGVACVSNDRVLLKNQTTASQNGIWIVHNAGDPAPHAAGLWVRADDLPAAAESGYGWAVMVRAGGTVNADTAWAIVAGDTGQPVVGTDALTFQAIVGPFPVPISKGGTGANTQAAAQTALGAATVKASTITGDGATTSFSLVHGLNNKDISITVREVTTDQIVYPTAVALNNTTASITFAAAPAAAKQYRIIVMGVQA